MMLFSLILISLSIFGFGVFFVRMYDEIKADKHEKFQRMLIK